ncbi:MAG: GHMP kinase [Saprospirales bacterium]|nr:GHMP kinase [Saprospirales bacterium]
MYILMRANGKLLLSGEYFVLDGAVALALPTVPGQTMRITEEGIEGLLRWTSIDSDGKPWFEGDFELPGLSYIKGTHEDIGQRIQQILEAICTLSPTFLLNQTCLTIETRLEFSRLWGLGSSSTLIYLLAQWAGVNPFQLLKSTFGGSGYDIAAAGQAGPFLYRVGNPPEVTPCAFQPPFASQLYFVYLGQKQDSREGIHRYRERQPVDQSLIDQVSALTHSFLTCRELTEFDQLIRTHEVLLSDFLDLPRARDLYFSDFWGEIKSLGAWGGDFVLATSARSETETQAYFNESGFSVFLPYRQLILT